MQVPKRALGLPLVIQSPPSQKQRSFAQCFHSHPPLTEKELTPTHQSPPPALPVNAQYEMPATREVRNIMHGQGIIAESCLT